jgi:hypothetical protein
LINVTLYYLQYRRMALLDQDPMFSAICHFIESINRDGEHIDGRLSGSLLSFLDEPELLGRLPAPDPLPVNYEKSFIHSKVVRFRNHITSATLFSVNHNFFSLQHGEAILDAVRISAAFFGKGQFKSEHLEFEGNEIVLRSSLTGSYMQPLAPGAIPGDGEWHLMDHKKRARSEYQHFDTVIRIIQASGGFTLKFQVTGTDRVPLAIELGFRPGGSFTGVEKVPGTEHAWFLRSGMGQYRVGDHQIRFGPGRNAHDWTQLRGAEPKLHAESVYITGYSPFEYELEIGVSG